jgi:hypothetical protein
VHEGDLAAPFDPLDALGRRAPSQANAALPRRGDLAHLLALRESSNHVVGELPVRNHAHQNLLVRAQLRRSSRWGSSLVGPPQVESF